MIRLLVINELKRAWKDTVITSFEILSRHWPVTEAARSKTWTLFALSDSGMVGLNPTQGVNVWCVYAFILCLGSGLATGWSLVQEVLPYVKKMITELNKRPGPWLGWKSHWKKKIKALTGRDWERLKEIAKFSAFSCQYICYSMSKF
jgi:hypothetical protein